VKLLLDTHIWLWSLVAPGRLSRRVARALEDADNELWLSPISVWEFLLLVERGRVILKETPRAWLEAAWSRAPMTEAATAYRVTPSAKKSTNPPRVEIMACPLSKRT